MYLPKVSNLSDPKEETVSIVRYFNFFPLSLVPSDQRAFNAFSLDCGFQKVGKTDHHPSFDRTLSIKPNVAHHKYY